MSQDPDPTIQRSDEASEEEPDLEGEESFPASDPPAHWMGEDGADQEQGDQKGTE